MPGIFVNVSVITFQEAGLQKIFAFTLGLDAHLYVNYWDGAQWQWADQGMPSGIRQLNSVEAITFQDPESQQQMIYVFVVAEDSQSQGHLYVNYWDGAQWQWADQGSPLASFGTEIPLQIGTNVGVISYSDEFGIQKIYAFVTAFDGNLYVNYWDGAQWQWADQGLTKIVFAGGNNSGPTVITYQDPRTLQRLIYAFISDVADSKVYANYWDGTQWQWIDLGGPAAGLLDGGYPAVLRPAALTFARRIQYIFVFNAGGVEDGQLYVNYWNGVQWTWSDLGMPLIEGNGIGTPVVTPGVITFEVPGFSTLEPSIQWIYAFTTADNLTFGNDANLYVATWNSHDGIWQWIVQGTNPNAASIAGSPTGVITFQEGGIQKIYAFVVGQDAHLYVNYWDGAQWQWADQGMPQ